MDPDSENALDTTELLAQLKGIHLPEAPVAPNLWPMILSLIICAVAALVFARRHLRGKQTWHHSALDTLDGIQKQENINSNDSLHQTAVLLKRIALTEGGRESVQRLNGEPWLNYLDTFFATEFFSAGDGRVFGEALYKAEALEKETVLSDLKQLIKRHKRQHS